jgi:hypothetical protein
MPVILATRETEIKRITTEAQTGQMVEWLKVYALSTNPSTTKKKKKSHHGTTCL